MPPLVARLRGSHTTRAIPLGADARVTERHWQGPGIGVRDRCCGDRATTGVGSDTVTCSVRACREATRRIDTRDRANVRQRTDRIERACYAVGMPGSGGDLSPLEKAWREALTEYTREVKRTLELLTSPGLPDSSRLEAIEQQRAAEQIAFERFRRARRAFLESILRGVGGLVVVLALCDRGWV